MNLYEAINHSLATRTAISDKKTEIERIMGTRDVVSETALILANYAYCLLEHMSDDQDRLSKKDIKSTSDCIFTYNQKDNSLTNDIIESGDLDLFIPSALTNAANDDEIIPAIDLINTTFYGLGKASLPLIKFVKGKAA